MTNLRLWVLLLALTAFLVGAATGPWVARWLFPSARAAEQGPFEQYERALVETFQLGPERRAPLHAILEEYRHDLERIKDRHMADYMSSIEPELRERGRFYRDLVRDRVLPEGQRAEFDRLSLGLPGPTNP